jgi:group I intron endonuclease
VGNKNRHGVYQIINLVTGHKYIGSTKYLTGRERQHLNDLRKKKHKNPRLQRAFNKYGEKNFKFEIICECEIKNLLVEEQKELDRHNKKNMYNICKIAGSTLGIKHSATERARKSKVQKGKRPSDETIEKIRNTLTGVKHTPERRKNLSIAHKGKNTGWESAQIKPVIQIDAETSQEIRFWVSATEAEKELRAKGIKIRSINIRKVCHNYYGRKTAGGFKWRFATPEEIEKERKKIKK